MDGWRNEWMDEGMNEWVMCDVEKWSANVAKCTKDSCMYACMQGDCWVGMHEECFKSEVFIKN